MAVRLNDWLGGTVDDCFDAMTVRIDYEASIVVGAVVGPWSRAAVVSASMQKRSLVELVH